MTVPTTRGADFVAHAAGGRARTVRLRDEARRSDHGLTQRERDVAHLLAEGLTAYSIGRALAISERTVHKHLQNVYRKLGAHDRLGAVRVLESMSAEH